MAVILHTNYGPREVRPARDVDLDEPSGIHILIDPEAAFRAAIFRASTAPSAADLGDTWQAFVEGRLHFHSAERTSARHYVVARIGEGGAPILSQVESVVLCRVLAGEPQKVIAADLGIACSTTSKWFARALEKLNLNRALVPIPLVVAAQSFWLGERMPRIEAEKAFFTYEGVPYFSLCLARPLILPNSPLTASEREIAQRLLEGDSRRDIAEQRSTSAQTVASQLGAIFAKLGLRGRYPLIRLAADSSWFGATPVAGRSDDPREGSSSATSVAARRDEASPEAQG
jgi:DNA-binding NarL/FixJ family response regulator